MAGDFILNWWFKNKDTGEQSGQCRIPAPLFARRCSRGSVATRLIGESGSRPLAAPVSPTRRFLTDPAEVN